MTDLAGHPVVWIGYGTDVGSEQNMPTGEGRLVLLDRPGHAVTLFEGKATFFAGVADSHGTWLGGTPGVFLLTPGGTFEMMSALVAQPAGECQ